MLSRDVHQQMKAAAEEEEEEVDYGMEEDYDGDDEALSLCDLPIYGDDNESADADADASSFSYINEEEEDDDECFEFSFSSSCQSLLQEYSWPVVHHHHHRPQSHDEKNIIMFCGKMMSSSRKESTLPRSTTSKVTPPSKWYNLLMFGLVRIDQGNYKMELKDIRKRQISRRRSSSTSTTSGEIGDNKKKKKFGGQQLGTMWSFLRTTFGCTTTSHVDSTNPSLWRLQQLPPAAH